MCVGEWPFFLVCFPGSGLSTSFLFTVRQDSEMFLVLMSPLSIIFGSIVVVILVVGIKTLESDDFK